MSSSVQARPYQLELERQTHEAWANGAKTVALVMPTGAGKSIVLSSIVLKGYQDGMIQCVIAHRNELVSQMSAHIGRRSIPHRIIGADSTVRQIQRQHRLLFNGQQFVHPTARTSVVGVNTMVARKDDLSNWAYRHDQWLGDEFHHFLRDNLWGKAVAMMPNARGLGVTATPCRADGQGLGSHADGFADVMLVGPSMRWLIDQNFLCDYEIVCPRSDMVVRDEDVSASGDWSNATMRKAAKVSHIVGDVVENYCRYAYGRRAIVFSTDVETAGEIAAKFSAAGIPAASLSAKTPVAVREKYDNEFKSGKIWVLINVDLYDEGYDCPNCDVIIMARPTASLGKYRQQIGRVLRYVPGKVALIIDMVSNVVRHNLPDHPIAWTLDRRDKRGKQVKDPDEIPLTECRVCTKPYHKFMVACPHCGAEKPLPEPRERTLEMVEGDLVLLDRETLAKMRAATIMEQPVDIAARVAAAAGEIAGRGVFNRQKEKLEAYEELKEVMAQWAAIRRAKGDTDREIQKRFYYAAGMDVLSALDTSRPRSEMQSITQTIKGWWSHVPCE